MTIVIIIGTVVTVAYTALMAIYIKGWYQQRNFKIPNDFVPSTMITVIVPARNEQDNIGACIDSLLDQKYPQELYEIIVVDDHSDDRTAAIVAEYHQPNVKCLHLAEYLPKNRIVTAYKKAAINAGVQQSTGTLIVTTDADCLVPNAWLLHIAAIYERTHPAMIVAPVMYPSYNGILELFQVIDFMTMQGITAASHSLKLGNMSNGANLAFRKNAFLEVGGYSGTEHLATGDDYLLMNKIAKASPGGIAYLKTPNAVVTTAPQRTWKSFIQQRIRWASKSGKYSDQRLTAILSLVYIFNLVMLFIGVWGFFNPYLWHLALAMIILKIVAESFFILPVARFFHKEGVLKYFPFLQPLHVVYIVATGFLGFVGKYEWKGRKVS